MADVIKIPACRIMLVDDHEIFCQGLGEIIEKTAPNCIFRYYTDTERAGEELKNESYQFLICDLLVPGGSIKDLIIESKIKYPRILVIILSSVMNTNIIKELFAIGINGYLSKAVSYSELKTAFENIYNGNKYISSDLGGRVATSFFQAEKSGLTKKEIAILQQIAAGNTVNMIAGKLLISPHTVMAHRRNIMAKLDLHSVAELVKYVYENKLF